jgi:Caspase domain
VVDAHTRGARGDELSALDLIRLRPFVVNLTQGRLSGDGRYQTTRADVDAIFDVHLPAAVAEHEDGPLPLVIWAHGGLISEGSGLNIANGQVDWWRRNGAYPLHFVWESGFLDALGEAVRAALPFGARDIFDFTSDPVIEAVARPVGSRLWLAMKTSARLASDEDGGARYVADRLVAFHQANPSALSVHAVGHSAGSIFHAHFLPMLLEQGLPTVESLQLLAPAIRVDEFLRRVAPRLGSGLDELVLYTMRRELERDDSCIGLYRKSLLYLVQRSFEQDDARVLGLEDELLADERLTELFGLGNSTGRATVVWSRTDTAAATNSRTTSTSHGGFDNDSPTMESVLRRITGRDQVRPFPTDSAAIGRRAWLQAGIRPEIPRPPGSPAAPGRAQAAGQSNATCSSGDTGRRRALCVGVDDYPDPFKLAGCVADARAWADRLREMEYDVDVLIDREASREGILTALRRLIASAAPGDILVFQYSGHGTQVPDIDGDDVDGTNGDYDEALCPIDYMDGLLLLDDDLRMEIAALPELAELTVFLDCCHSGTGTRFGAPGPQVTGNRRAGVRARYLPATRQLWERHKEFRRSAAVPNSCATGGRATTAQDVLFSAALDRQVAYETDGQGDFTRHALDVLSSGAPLATNGDFIDAVLARFGESARQTPQLDRAESFRSRPFLSRRPARSA